MTAAQRDINSGFRVNLEAQVAELQLIKVLENVISSMHLIGSSLFWLV